MVVSQGNTYVVIYDSQGFACTTLDTGWQHTCHYKVWTMDNHACEYDPAHVTLLATDNVDNAMTYHIQDSYYGITDPPSTKGVTLASNCKTYTVGAETLVPVNYEPRETQQIADYTCCGVALAATICLYIGVRRLLSMLHSAVIARKG